MIFFQVFLTLSLAAPCLTPIPLLGQNTNAQPGATQPSLPSASATAPSTEDEAAARKKRFAEGEAKLENSVGQTQSQPTSATTAAGGCDANDLSISPDLVNMLVGETQGFSLFDLGGHKMTFQAEWSVSDSAIADLTMRDDQPVLTGRRIGSVRVIARVDTHTTAATVNVIALEDMKPGTIRWQVPPIRCAQFLPRIPNPAPCSASEIELTIVPQFAGIFVGQTKPFKLLDAGGHDLSSLADWSIDDSHVAGLTIKDGVPVLTGKETGTVHLTARLDSRSREAIIEAVTHKDWDSGKAHFSTRPVPCSRSLGTSRPLPPEALPFRPPDTGKPTSPQR